VFTIIRTNACDPHDARPGSPGLTRCLYHALQDSSSGRAARATVAAAAWYCRFMGWSWDAAGRDGRTSAVAPVGTAQAGMCSSRCHGDTMRSRPSLVPLDVIRILTFGATFAQVSRPQRWSPSQDQRGMLRPSGTSSAES